MNVFEFAECSGLVFIILGKDDLDDEFECCDAVLFTSASMKGMQKLLELQIRLGNQQLEKCLGYIGMLWPKYHRVL